MNTAPAYRVHLAVVGLDASRVVRGLYQGAAPPVGSTVRRAGFDLLVLCARELLDGSAAQRPDRFPGVEVVLCPLDDGYDPATGAGGRFPTPDEEARARAVARRVAAALWSGRRALVTCRAGLNRSGFVTALALSAATGCAGHEAAAHVRRARPGALFNPFFLATLAAVPAGGFG